MNSELLNSLGIGGIDPGYIFIGLAALLLVIIILLIVQISKTSKLQKKYGKFMRGKDAKSLEKEIIGLYEDNKFLKTTAEKNKSDIRNIYKRLESAFQKVGLVKYDAFQDSLAFHLHCLMRMITDSLSIPYTAPKVAIPIQRKSKTAFVLLPWGMKKRRL